MPKIQERKVIEVELASVPGGVVKVYDSLLARDIEQVVGMDGNAKVTVILSRLIREWNIEDDKGKPLAVTPENVGKLDIRDVTKIFSEAKITKDFLGAAKETPDSNG